MPAPALVLFSMVGIQAGHACGKLLFGEVGPSGVVAMRLGFTALVLMALWRPRLPPDRPALGLVVALAALISAPVSLPATLNAAQLQDGLVPLLTVLLAGLGVALLSAIVPYSLDLAALRRMPPRVFGIMMSLEPVLGGLAGLALLGEHLAPRHWLAIACVILASLAVVTPSPRRKARHP